MAFKGGRAQNHQSVQCHTSQMTTLSSLAKIFGTSPELSMLLMSSTKDSLIIWVSENKKATGVLRLSSTWDRGKDHGQREKWTKATGGNRRTRKEVQVTGRRGEGVVRMVCASRQRKMFFLFAEVHAQAWQELRVNVVTLLAVVAAPGFDPIPIERQALCFSDGLFGCYSSVD